MGLDFSHGNAHWAYSGFSRFRKRLAAVYGVDLDQMVGFQHPWEEHKVPNPIPWTTQCGELQDLINHSDCDGHLTPTQCKKIAPALRRAVELWADNDWDKNEALKLAEGMEEAIEAKENFEFQ